MRLVTLRLRLVSSDATLGLGHPLGQTWRTSKFPGVIDARNEALVGLMSRLPGRRHSRQRFRSMALKARSLVGCGAPAARGGLAGRSGPTAGPRQQPLDDGAAEMWNVLGKEFNEAELKRPVECLVDLWHLLEKVGKALRERYDGQRASAELHRWKMRLLNQGEAWRKLLAEVMSWGLDRGAGQKCVVHDAVTFLTNQGEAGRLDYARARQQGRPVGSGVVEATCKSLFNVRLKRGGARWREERAGRLIRLRALALSGRWAPAMGLLRGKVAVEVRRVA